MESTRSMALLSPQELSADYTSEIAPVDAMKQVMEVSGSDLEDVFRKVQGPPGNPVQVVTAWWMVKTTGLQKKEVAKRLNMSNSAVGRAVRRIHSESVRNPKSDIVVWSKVLLEQRENAD